eukprot:gene18085-biopygen42370
MAVGTTAFRERFLAQQVLKIQDLIDRIVELPALAGPHQPAVQVANLLLRYCVASKCSHLLRLLPPPSTASFCRDVDDRVARAFCAINDITEHFGPIQRQLYSTPTAWGGLGMRQLFDVRNAAFVGAWLQCLSHVRTAHGSVIPDFDVGWDPGGARRYSFRCALDGLDVELEVGTSAFEVLGLSARDALWAERPKCQKQLSRSVLARKLVLWKDTLDPKSRALAILHGASSESRRPLASEWLST